MFISNFSKIAKPVTNLLKKGEKFPILMKLGAMTYKLELPPYLVGVHDVYHVSQLKKCWKTPADVIVNDVTPLEADLSYPWASG
jgi:hypothetical protein